MVSDVGCFCCCDVCYSCCISLFIYHLPLQHTTAILKMISLELFPNTRTRGMHPLHHKLSLGPPRRPRRLHPTQAPRLRPFPQPHPISSPQSTLRRHPLSKTRSQRSWQGGQRRQTRKNHPLRVHNVAREGDFVVPTNNGVDTHVLDAGK